MSMASAQKSFRDFVSNLGSTFKWPRELDDLGLVDDAAKFVRSLRFIDCEADSTLSYLWLPLALRDGFVNTKDVQKQLELVGHQLSIDDQFG